MHSSRWVLAALCLACLGFAGPSRQDDVRDTMEPMVTDLHWLTGQWAGSDGESDWEATYSTAKGGMLVGASKELAVLLGSNLPRLDNVLKRIAT